MFNCKDYDNSDCKRKKPKEGECPFGIAICNFDEDMCIYEECKELCEKVE